MAEPVLADQTWYIEFTQEEIGPIAATIAEDLQKADVATVIPTYKPPREATLGTPEIIVTIVVTAAAKALIVAGLHALEKTLEKQIDHKNDRRAQIIVTSPTKSKQRFPVSLKNITKDALKEFMSQVVSVVNQV
jgi:hypothetical protein